MADGEGSQRSDVAASSTRLLAAATQIKCSNPCVEVRIRNERAGVTASAQTSRGAKGAPVVRSWSEFG